MSVEPILYPEAVVIETLNTCNARCIFCPLFQGDHQLDRKVRPAKILEQELYETYMAELAGWEEPPKTIFLNMDGEPLQDPFFCARMKTMKQHGFGSVLTLQTNGQLLNEEKAAAILDAEVAIVVFGFDGASKDVYEAHRVRCHYEHVLDNIRAFVALRDERKSSTIIQIKFVRTKLNCHEVRAAYKMFSQFMDKDKDSFWDTLAIDWSNALLPQEDKDIYYCPKVVSAPPSRGCASLDKHMIVTVNGKIAGCCFDYNFDVSDGGFVIGDQTLLDTWRCKEREALRQRVSSDDMAEKPLKCHTCPALYKFKLTDKQIPLVPEACQSENELGFSYRFGVEI